VNSSTTYLSANKSGGDSISISGDTLQGPGDTTVDSTSSGGCGDPCSTTAYSNWTMRGGNGVPEGGNGVTSNYSSFRV
jgi:hypothetical protein